MNELEISKTMTTKELAEAFGVDVSTITKTVARLNETSDVLPKFTQGQTPRYTESQATLIKMEIQKHHNLANRQIDGTSTELEENMLIARGWEILQRRNEELKKRAEEAEAENAKLKPAAAFAYQLCSSQDTIDIGNCAKVLNRRIGRNNLFEFLRNKKVLQSDNIPYQKYIDSGYFRVIESKFVTPTGETKICLKTVVFQKGVAYINKLLKEAANEN
ncbi:MAG: phage antirepressor KilAC domain-containing protein [Treponema sp.]|nr:phage antirepressor KilAC domain-containing protein [Treponema sp.]